MGLSELTSRQAVLDAVAEFDRLGRARFLDHYGFRAVKTYYLEQDGCYYDSKAITAVAFGKQFPSRGPLRSKDLSGGVSTVEPKLKELGFTVVRRNKIPV